jgi:hypothetical protein
VLRREVAHIQFADAVTMIARGELLWAPPERFERLTADTSPDAVQREHLLLSAFLRSPAGERVTKWTMRLRLELRNTDDREWLANHALTQDNADGPNDEQRRAG